MPRKSKARKSKRNIKNPCGICSNPVASNHKAVWCDTCHLWIHISCNNTSKTEYQRLQQDHNSWFCQKCFNSEVPFGQIPRESLKLTLQGKNFDPFLDLFNDINLQFYRDIDSALAQDDEDNNTFNFQCPYLSLSELNDKHKNNDSISTLHLNIASLNLHHAELVSTLNNCEIPFDFIGITETGFKDKILAQNTAKILNYTHFDCCTKSSRGEPESISLIAMILCQGQILAFIKKMKLSLL